MVNFFNNILFSRQYIPHGHCYLWQSGLLWLHILSDLFIALAYYSIPLLLIYFVRQRDDVPFRGIFILFSLFILSCGTTHMMSIWTLWHPDYWLSGLIKAITAFISVYTAVELIPILPQALALRSPTELAAANQALEIEIVNRQQIEETLKKTNQELCASNKELENFAYLASHDLREPLRMVTSFTKLLARRYSSQLDTEADKIIGFAVDGATRMEELINNLLEYSRISKQTNFTKSVDCELVLDCALRNLKLLIKETNAEITRTSLPTVLGDSEQLIQLFQNLIENALTYRGQEPPKIAISAEAREEQWLFFVQDNGIGIESKYRDRIFQIFQRLHTREEYPGTGIGLAICRKIVERHNGQIWVESELGQGATFYFTIKIPVEIGDC